MWNPMMVMEEMRRDQLLCDAVIQVDGSQFKVHKLVLCGLCPFFKSLFTIWPIPDNSVYVIPNLSADIMQVFIEFAYTGVFSITEVNIHKLFIAADRFSVVGITQACCKVLEKSLSPQTCLNTWWMTNKVYYPELRQKVFSYILRHFEELVTCPDFLQLSLEDLLSFIRNNHLNVRQEATVFKAILLWINNSPKDRKSHIKDLLPKVRLAFIDSQFFTDHIIGNELVRQNPTYKTHLIRTMELMLNVQPQGSLISPSSYHWCPRVPRGVLIAVGGKTIKGVTNAIEFYDNRAKHWVLMDNKNETPRAFHGTVFLNECMYIIGGSDGVKQLSTMQKYDLINHTWQEVAPMHSQRFSVSVAVMGGFIYAMGGCAGLMSVNTAERYDPETNQWTMIAAMNEQRSDASSATLNGKIYICGGFKWAECLDTAECYDPQTNQWTLIPSMNSPRSGVRVVAYAGEIFTVGGYDGVDFLNTFEAYDPETRQWRILPSMINPRWMFGIGVLDDELYVFGGAKGANIISCVESFDARTGVWSVIEDMEVPRLGLSSCTVCDLPNMSDYSALEVASAAAAGKEET